jgi:hypothetical protein
MHSAAPTLGEMTLLLKQPNRRILSESTIAGWYSIIYYNSNIIISSLNLDIYLY